METRGGPRSSSRPRQAVKVQVSSSDGKIEHIQCLTDQPPTDQTSSRNSAQKKATRETGDQPRRSSHQSRVAKVEVDSSGGEFEHLQCLIDQLPTDLTAATVSM